MTRRQALALLQKFIRDFEKYKASYLNCKRLRKSAEKNLADIRRRGHAHLVRDVKGELRWYDNRMADRKKKLKEIKRKVRIIRRALKK